MISATVRFWKICERICIVANQSQDTTKKQYRAKPPSAPTLRAEAMIPLRVTSSPSA
jgi:DsbC/DsbD-like thiol-disulfide interchange protein